MVLTPLHGRGPSLRRRTSNNNTVVGGKDSKRERTEETSLSSPPDQNRIGRTGPLWAKDCSDPTFPERSSRTFGPLRSVRNRVRLEGKKSAPGTISGAVLLGSK